MPEEKVFPSESADDDEDGDDESSTMSYQESTEDILDPTPQDIFENPDSIELKKSRKYALLEFRCRVEDAILGKYILGKNRGRFASNVRENFRDITLWGVPLLPSKAHEGTDIVLMKFLKAKDYNASEAFNLLRRTLKWRKAYNCDVICEEKLGSSDGNVVCINGEDKQGRPVCYNVFGAFKERELGKNGNNNGFGVEEEKSEEFLRWKVQSMEKCIKQLRFKVGGVDSVLQITDMKNSPGPAMKELRSLNKKTMVLFQENYPELIFRNIFINVPFWYFLSHALHSKFSHRTKKKFIFARPSRATQTLLKYISAENIPLQYGGLKRDKDTEFSPCDKALSKKVRGNAVQIIQIPIAEAGVTVTWDVTVVGFDVAYKEEFIPDDDCSYNVLLQEEKKMRESARNSFYIYEPGKIVITICNGTAKKKKIFYRHKSKPTLPLFYIPK